MRIKRFVAPTMRDAATQVHREFGPDALIMRTGRVRQPGLLGLFRPRWIAVTAGLDERVERKVPERSASCEAAPAATRSESPVSQGKLNALAVAHLVKRLRQQEVAEEYLGELSEQLEARVGMGGEAPQRHLLGLLAEQIKVARPWAVGSERPLVVPLVGPTGVGKTTTVAKLAATYALRCGCRVGLVTADTYRVAAVEQLRTYADILSIPLEVVYSPSDVAPALQRLQERELVLVDTAGRSPHNQSQMEELRALLAEMGSSRVHLVISATTRHADMVEIVDRFVSHAAIEGLVVTKLDETNSYGIIYNVIRRTGQSIAYITNGQGVPEDMAAADALQLARLIVGVET
jgi:flagellar biosynthesis protein FlhF